MIVNWTSCDIFINFGFSLFPQLNCSNFSSKENRIQLPRVRLELTTLGLWDLRSANWAIGAHFDSKNYRSNQIHFLYHLIGNKLLLNILFLLTRKWVPLELIMILQTRPIILLFFSNLASNHIFVRNTSTLQTSLNYILSPWKLLE